MRYASILLFAALFAFAEIRWGVPHQVGVAYLVASVTSFVAYAMDKSAARAGRWRTSESTLLLLGLACGWPGAALAQQWLRHKSTKASFRVSFWATVVLNICAFLYLSSPASFLLRGNEEFSVSGHNVQPGIGPISWSVGASSRWPRILINDSVAI